MQLGQRLAESSAVSRGRPADPHSVEEGDHRGGPPCDHAEHLAFLILDRQRAVDAASMQMLHQPKKERQVFCRDPFFVQRQDEIIAARVHEEIRVLDAFRDAFVGQQFSEVIVGEKSGKLLRRDISIDGHVTPPVAGVCSFGGLVSPQHSGQREEHVFVGSRNSLDRYGITLVEGTDDFLNQNFRCRGAGGHAESL